MEAKLFAAERGNTRKMGVKDPKMGWKVTHEGWGCPNGVKLLKSWGVTPE